VPIQWTSLRLRRSTHAKLCALRDKMHADYQACLLSLPDDQTEHLGLDYVILRLIQNHFAHARRRAKARSKSGNGKDKQTQPV